MKKIIISLALLICGCTSNGPNNQGSNPTPSNSPVVSPAPETPSEADQTKFLGEWKGKYGCAVGSEIDDKIMIQKGDNSLEFKIDLFLLMDTPTKNIKGVFKDINNIEIPKQQINGAETFGTVSFKDGKLNLMLNGLGIECNGNNYTK